MGTQFTLTMAAAAAVTAALEASSGVYSLGPSMSIDTVFANGTGTSQVEDAWFRSETISTGSNTYDLNALAQKDSGGATLRTVNLTQVKAIVVINGNTAGGTGTLRIGGAGAQPFTAAGFLVDGTDKLDVVPGGVFVWTNPVGVATSGANNLEVAAVDANTVCTILVAGEVS